MKKLIFIILTSILLLGLFPVSASHGTPPISTIKDITDNKKDESFLPDLITESISFGREHNYELINTNNYNNLWDKWNYHQKRYMYDLLGINPKIIISQPVEEDCYLRAKIDATNGGRIICRIFKIEGNEKLYLTGVTRDSNGNRIFHYEKGEYNIDFELYPGLSIGKETETIDMDIIPKGFQLEIIVVPEVTVNFDATHVDWESSDYRSIVGKVEVESNPTKINIDIDISKINDGAKPDNKSLEDVSDTIINIPNNIQESILDPTQTVDTITGETDLKLDIPTVDPPVEVDPEIYMPITQDELNRRKELLDEYDKLYNNNKIKIDELSEDIQELKDIFYRKNFIWLIANTVLVVDDVPKNPVPYKVLEDMGNELMKKYRYLREENFKINPKSDPKEENLKFKRITDKLAEERKIKEKEIIRLINENEAIKNAKMRELEDLREYKIVEPDSNGFGINGGENSK